MQIALFGATGGTGRKVLEQALASGHAGGKGARLNYQPAIGSG
jgi:uncharacterized protein YbjT (DUF2867 family)